MIAERLFGGHGIRPCSYQKLTEAQSQLLHHLESRLDSDAQIATDRQAMEERQLMD